MLCLVTNELNTLILTELVWITLLKVLAIYYFTCYTYITIHVYHFWDYIISLKLY